MLIFQGSEGLIAQEAEVPKFTLLHGQSQSPGSVQGSSHGEWPYTCSTTEPHSRVTGSERILPILRSSREESRSPALAII